jgi:hypothetical protein
MSPPVVRLADQSMHLLTRMCSLAISEEIFFVAVFVELGCTMFKA